MRLVQETMANEFGVTYSNNGQILKSQSLVGIIDLRIFTLMALKCRLFQIFTIRLFRIYFCIQFVNMKKLLGYDQAYDDLKEIGLVGNNFEYLPLALIRRYAKTLVHAKELKELSGVLQKIISNNKSSMESIKILIFINFLLDEMQESALGNIDSLVNQYINKILTLQQNRLNKFQSSRSRQNSFDKAKDWFKQRISRSKDKIKQKLSKSFSQSSKITPRIEQPFALNSYKNTENTPRAEQKQAKHICKQELLIQDLIFPYILYLREMLKLISSQINFRSQSKMKTSQVWKILNLLKSILKISSCFTELMRYFKRDFGHLVSTLIQTLDYDIKCFNSAIYEYIAHKNKIIQKQVQQTYKDAINEEQKMARLRQIVNVYALSQFKEIICEYALIKQSLLVFYRGNAVLQKILLLDISLPKGLHKSFQSQNLIFQILDQVNKYKNGHKRESSLTKSTNKVASIKRPVQIKQISKPMDKQLKQFTEKRMKILPQAQKMETKETPKTTKQVLTFRKLRLNVTDSLEDETTKRQGR